MRALSLFVTTASLIALSGVAFAQAAPAAAPLTKADVQAIVKETLMDNPEVIMQALEKLRTQKAEQAKQEAAAALAKYRGEIFNNPDIPSTGASAADADVTIVEFFDYHCGYCKHFLPELAKVVAADKKLRVLLIDFPILSEDSVMAAKAAIAVNRINKAKYFDFHTALMQHSGKFDDKAIEAVAKKTGVNVAALKTEMAKPEISSILDKHRALAGELGIQGTPALIVGNEIIPGALGAEELKKYIAGTRAGKAAPAAK